MTAKVSRSTKRSVRLEIQKFLRANASTLLATGIEWALVSVLVGFHISYLIAAAIGSLLGAVMDFSVKRKWAFMRRGKNSLQAESTRYIMVSALSLGWNLLVAYLLVNVAHMMAIPAVIAASIVVGAFWNYPMHRLFVFPDTQKRATVQKAA